MNRPLSIVVVAEAGSDARRAMRLVDRVVIEQIDWLREQPELLDAQRQWVGLDASAAFVDLHKVHKFADQRGIPRAHGHFEGRPATEDYPLAVRALWLLAEFDVDVVVWIRDTDGSALRAQGWREAWTKAAGHYEAAISGFPDQCMESWLLAAWTPTDDEEHGRFQMVQQHLGFDPLVHPQLLSHKTTAPKNAKQVVEELGTDERGLEHASLELLRERGHGCGLTRFIIDIEDQLVQLLR